jgi:hypothetical protein
VGEKDGKGPEVGVCVPFDRGTALAFGEDDGAGVGVVLEGPGLPTVPEPTPPGPPPKEHWPQSLGHTLQLSVGSQIPLPHTATTSKVQLRLEAAVLFA